MRSASGSNQDVRAWRRGLPVGVSLLLLLFAACQEPPAPPPPGAPKLLLLVVIDQGCYEYLERFDDLFSGGVRRLLDEGASFTRARHGHSVSVTAAGHAALSTGSHPRRSGIVGNGWVDRESGDWVYCVGDARDDRSPRNLLVSALGDWLKERYPEARVVSASGKDRAAVLLGGHRADGAFWVDRDTGQFTTSGYYGSRLPRWLERFNERGWLEREVFGRPWEPLPAVAALSAEERQAYGVDGEDDGAFPRGFPHRLGWISVAPGRSFYRGVYESPFVDAYLAQLVPVLVEGEGLGTDEVTDLLALSFSATDTVGHEYGPNSLEVLDTLLRLDALLGELFERLQARVGDGGLVIALSSDHGVASLPEHEGAYEGHGRRLGAEDVACFQRAWEAMTERFGEGDWVLQDLYLDRSELAKAGIALEEAEEVLARSLESCPAVKRVWTSSELDGKGAVAEATRESPSEGGLFRNGFYAERSPDLALQLRPEVLADIGRGTTHGSVYDHDTRVPLIVWGSGISAGLRERPVWTVDLAPTLAELSGVPVPEEIDGRSLVADLRGGELATELAAELAAEQEAP